MKLFTKYSVAGGSPSTYDIECALEAFHHEHMVEPGKIILHRIDYSNYMKAVNVSPFKLLEPGKKYVMYMLTSFGPLPVIPSMDSRYQNFVTVTDNGFVDKEFEKIVMQGNEE